jgi:hypothetical protein
MPTEVGQSQLLQLQQRNFGGMLKGNKKYLPPVTKVHPN